MHGMFHRHFHFLFPKVENFHRFALDPLPLETLFRYIQNIHPQKIQNIHPQKIQNIHPQSKSKTFMHRKSKTCKNIYVNGKYWYWKKWLFSHTKKLVVLYFLSLKNSFWCCQYCRLWLETVFNLGMLICLCVNIIIPTLVFVDVIMFNLFCARSRDFAKSRLINAVKFWTHISVNGFPEKGENSNNGNRFKGVKQWIEFREYWGVSWELISAYFCSHCFQIFCHCCQPNARFRPPPPKPSKKWKESLIFTYEPFPKAKLSW